jgi:hypothetical protein
MVRLRANLGCDLSCARNKAYFKTLVQGQGNPLKHRGVTFIIRVLEPSDHGLSCTDDFGQLLLGEFCLCAHLVDLLRNLGVNKGFIGLLAKICVVSNLPV